jgi:hypothetical protein
MQKAAPYAATISDRDDSVDLPTGTSVCAVVAMCSCGHSWRSAAVHGHISPRSADTKTGIWLHAKLETNINHNVYWWKIYIYLVTI